MNTFKFIHVLAVNPNLELTESQELLVSTRNRDRSILNSAMSSGQYDQVPYTDYSYVSNVHSIQRSMNRSLKFVYLQCYFLTLDT